MKENKAVQRILAQKPFQKIREGVTNPLRPYVVEDGHGHFYVRLVRKMREKQRDRS